ncbi:exosome complex component RRP41 [Cephus cinctus]|uniref:Putative exosome complex component RRP41 n=1 Tax=Cephus cinctus TaxID=211228 RepID=A0AAJ7C0L9_CEPCN|nr:exosome complex component RRP41 [Cephus cinctus]
MLEGDQDQEEDQGGLRNDGRRAAELRKIRVRMGVFGQADGSAYLEQGNTKILVAVYGPHQPRGSAARAGGKNVGGIINCQYSTAVFSFSAGERKRRPRGDRKSIEKSLQLRRAMESIIQLDLYPRSQIDVFVEVLQIDGSEYCVAVNAATLALIDAGIPIKDYAIGCTASLIDSTSKNDEDSSHAAGVVDATYMEECSPGATLSIIALPGSSNDATKGLVVVAQGAGQRLHLSRLEALRNRALCGCRDIRNILDRAVRQHLTVHSQPSFSTLHVID